MCLYLELHLIHPGLLTQQNLAPGLLRCGKYLFPPRGWNFAIMHDHSFFASTTMATASYFLQPQVWQGFLPPFCLQLKVSLSGSFQLLSILIFALFCLLNLVSLEKYQVHHLHLFFPLLALIEFQLRYLLSSKIDLLIYCASLEVASYWYLSVNLSL